jgi:cytochrome b561
MDHATTGTSRYDRTTVALHWLTAALVVTLWGLGQTIDFFPKGGARVYARSVHISLGGVLLAVVAVRLGWRLGAGRRLPAAASGWLGRLGTWMPPVLYALLVGALLLGVANAWERGDNLFNLYRIPAFDAANEALRQTIEDWHEVCANVLLAASGLHAAAALLHHFVLRDGLLRRMSMRG